MIEASTGFQCFIQMSNGKAGQKLQDEGGGVQMQEYAQYTL